MIVLFAALTLTACGGNTDSAGSVRVAPTATRAAKVKPTATHAPAKRTPTPAQRTSLKSGCDPSYPDVCIPPAPPDLDCGDVPYRRFRVAGSDPHGFDRDGDGIGCETG